MIESENTIPVYEHNKGDGEGTKKTRNVGNSTEIAVKSHWNESSKVVIVTPSGEELTVVARDLHAAITNATNTAGF